MSTFKKSFDNKSLKSSIASFAIEGLKPSKDVIELSNKIKIGVIPIEAAVKSIIEKYQDNNYGK